MHRLMTAALAVMVSSCGLVMFSAPPAEADTVCSQIDPATGKCLIWVEVPGGSDDPGDSSDDAPKDTGAGKACFWDGSKQGVLDPPPGPVPCNSEYGYWSNAWNCYVRILEPQPPAGDPSWQGHEPGDGAIYMCYQPQVHLLLQIWSQDPPPDSGSGPTPREVAQIAIEQMDLRAIDIGITPKPGNGSIGIVGMPVWLWAANPNSHTVGPITESASAGGMTVSATARLRRITWDMGDGTNVRCTSAGTPYEATYGDKKSPDCGHVYTTSSAAKPGRKFTVSATSDWVIEWEGAGQTGTIRLNGLSRSVQITVGEAQVLVQ